MAFFIGGESDHAVATMPQGRRVLFADVDIDVPRKTGTMLVTLLEPFCPVDDVLNADIVFSLVPGRKAREVLRLYSAISVVLVDPDEIVALLIVTLHVFERRIEEAFLRPIDVQHSSVFAQLHRPLRKLALRLQLHH